MNNITLTKFQAVVLAILGCISISLGSDLDGYIADIFLVFGGGITFAALTLPTPKESQDE